MTRKFSREKAVSLITRDFVGVKILSLPDAMDREIKSIIDSLASAD
jgi:hypothetical protein